MPRGVEVRDGGDMAREGLSSWALAQTTLLNVHFWIYANGICGTFQRLFNHTLSSCLWIFTGAGKPYGLGRACTLELLGSVDQFLALALQILILCATVPSFAKRAKNTTPSEFCEN